MKRRALRVSFALVTAAAAGAGLVACGGSDSTGGGGSVTDGTDAATKPGADGAASTDATTGAGTDGAASHEAGSAADGGEGSTTDGASSLDSGGDAGADAGSCTPPVLHSSPLTTNAGTVTATVHDTKDMPVSRLGVSVTGLHISYPGTTSSTGAVSVTATAADEQQAFVFGDGLTYGRFVIGLPQANESLGTVHTVALPTTGAALAAGTPATSGPITLATTADTIIGIDTLDYSTPADQELRVASIPVAQVTLVGSSAPALELVFGTAPLETTFCPPATVTVTNSAGWAAGTAVDFYVLGDDVEQVWAPFGGWELLATGHVSSDGTSIVTDPGAGLPVLGTLGLKRH